MISTGNEKRNLLSVFIGCAIVFPILLGFVIPLYESFISSEYLSRYITPFGEQYSALGFPFLYIVFAKSPGIIYALILAISIYVSLKTPKECQFMTSLVAFIFALLTALYGLAVFFNNALMVIGNIVYPVGTDFPLIICFVYGVLLIYAASERKNRTSKPR